MAHSLGFPAAALLLLPPATEVLSMSRATAADDDLIPVEIDDAYAFDEPVTRKMPAFRIPDEARRPHGSISDAPTLIVARKPL